VNPTPASQSLESAIADATRASFELTTVTPVAGGCIHTALQVAGETSLGTQRYFAKTNKPERASMFAAEADGLAALRASGDVAVPGFVALGADDENAWIILDWLELAPLDGASAARLGTALARQHERPQARFGWPRDNFIGATPQVNGRSDDWLEFWRGKRLVPQLRLAAHNKLPTRLIDRGERLAADCEAFFRTYRPKKSLLHGDLWNGNAAALADGTPVVFDPAVYVGDREADVAMTTLFGGFPKEFLSAYRAAWALDDGYPVRRDFYNLYHQLNHANLFFGDYVRGSAEAIERLLAEIR
jgi:protein-ribulosamine 3-kinase